MIVAWGVMEVYCGVLIVGVVVFGMVVVKVVGSVVMW